ncbi:MAG: outer membrane protein assembly factor [Bacteroidales bacterium]|jgi:hypothetical protein|nr:outer membrane protein assembly factor [Bacteroidales bacterium]
MKKLSKYFVIRGLMISCVIALFFRDQPLGAQDNYQKDIVDIFTHGDTSVVSEPEIKKLYLPVLPIIGYAPANGFMLGAGVAGSILLDSARHTHISSALANLILTSKHQINLNVRHNIYLSHDTWIFQGDWRLLFFNQPTYGLGINDFPAAMSLNGLGIEDTDGAQPMTFNYLRMYETFFRRINKRFYAGIGWAVDYHFKLKDELLDLSAIPPFYTSHYLYNTARDFSTDHYSAIGLTGKILYDSRDNAINPYRGTYLDIGLRVNEKIFGSSKNSSRLLMEFRNYQLVGRGVNHFAFWLMGSIQLSGTDPYLALPSIGWDTYNRSGRGYLQGRFRGENVVYAESEFRFRIKSNGLLGGVIFINTITADNKFIDQKLFDRFAFGYGAGLRIKMNKETRTNICVDLGLGQNNSSGIYFGIQEAF